MAANEGRPVEKPSPGDRPGRSSAGDRPGRSSAGDRLDRELRRMALLHRRAMVVRARQGRHPAAIRLL